MKYTKIVIGLIGQFFTVALALMQSFTHSSGFFSCFFWNVESFLLETRYFQQ